MRLSTENYEINHERKFWPHEIATRKNLGLTKNPPEKNFAPTKYPREKFETHEKIFWTHEIPTTKNLGPTKYPRRHDGKMALDPRDPR